MPAELIRPWLGFPQRCAFGRVVVEPLIRRLLPDAANSTRALDRHAKRAARMRTARLTDHRHSLEEQPN